MKNIYFYLFALLSFAFIFNLDFFYEKEFENKIESKYAITSIKQDSLQLSNNDTTFWFKVTDSVIKKKHVNDSITIVIFVK